MTRPMSSEGLAEEARVEQMAFEFEYERHLTLVRTTRTQVTQLVRHDRWEAEAYERQERALLSGDVVTALAINHELRSNDRVENARHRALLSEVG